MLALSAAAAGAGPSGGATEDPVEAPPPSGSPFERQGMWIWYVSRSEGGSLGRIVARARRHGVGTVYVKAGDATDVWGQFSRNLVRRLHQGGLDVCAWTFVYGRYPAAEARVAAAAIEKGADCFVIDAEGHYEGRYASADRYMQVLRKRVGAAYPLALSSFPYVDYHPAFPYSVFLGPGGAQFNLPQMYWKAIGTTVRGVYDHTILFNRLWGRPIHPIGQTYADPGRRQIKRFRQYAISHGGLAPSWWSWQETSSGEWGALGSGVGGAVIGYRPVNVHPILRRGSRGDLVVWAQQHLVAAGHDLPVTGFFGPMTQAATRSFQRQKGLRADGVLGTRTWRLLLRYRPVRVRWSLGRRHARVAGGLSGAPRSASLPARAYEIDPGPRP